MKTYKKIDLYFNGDYICSNNQAKTCKAAKERYIELAEQSKHSFVGLTLIQKVVLNNPKGLTAYFDKTKR